MKKRGTDFTSNLERKISAIIDKIGGA